MAKTVCSFSISSSYSPLHSLLSLRKFFKSLIFIYDKPEVVLAAEDLIKHMSIVRIYASVPLATIISLDKVKQIVVCMILKLLLCGIDLWPCQ